MDALDEQALVRRLRQADEQAWTELCREWGEPLVAFVLASFRCGRDAGEEIVQRTMVRCVRSIGSYDPARGRLSAWLKAVARNEACTYLRRDADSLRAGPVWLETLASAAACLDRLPLPDELLALEDTRRLVRECLAGLSGRQAEALVAKYVEGLSVAAIAARLETSPKAVESLLSRSREAFRRLFAERASGQYSSAGGVQ